jgi:subtilisin family serine protease
MRLTRDTWVALIVSLGVPLGLFAIFARVAFAAPSVPADVPVYAGNQVIVRGLIPDIQTVVNRVRVGYSITLSLAASPVPIIPFAGTSLVIELFNVNNVSVTAAVEAINKEGIGFTFPVVASPNYQTAGAKWIVDGSPTAPIVPGASSSQMQRQWALNLAGIRLYTSTLSSRRTVTYTGNGVRIYVLDTSPISSTGTIQQNVHGVTVTIMSTQTVTPLTTTGALYMPGHGLFVAGLAHAVAPSASLYLVRVLDDYGRGNLFELERAVIEIANTEKDISGNTGSVMNLSLGVLAGTDPLTILQSLLDYGAAYGVVTVAAAGNDTVTQTEPMRLPAGFDEVIGVAGASQQRGRSCFSNAGDIAAPAGNGDAQCEPAVISNCASQPQYCVVSWYVTPTQSAGYGYGAGTSFAAPLVAGAAALYLEKQNGTATPVSVTQFIYSSTSPVGNPDLGAGILDLCRGFGRCGRYLPVFVPIVMR